MMKLRNILSRPYREAFMGGDALLPLSWPVQVTFMGQMFCCGAEKTCSLPGLDEDVGAADERTFARTLTCLDLAFAHHDVIARDDVFQMRRYPGIQNWYRENAHRMSLAALDNNRIITFASLLFPFQSVGTMRVSGDFFEKVNGEKLLKAMTAIHATSPIRKMVSDVPAIIQWAKECDIPMEEEGTGDSDPYEESCLYLLQDTFLLTKTQGTIATADNATMRDMLIGVIRAKASLRTGDMFFDNYFQALEEHVTVNENFTFVPHILNTSFIERNPREWKDTPYGWHLENQPVIPLLIWK